MERPPRRTFGVPVCTTPPPRVAEYLRSTCPPFSHTCAPIENIDGYIRDRGLTGDEEALYRKLYTPPPEHKTCVKKELVVPSDPLHVFVSFKVGKTVRVKISVPWEPVYLAQKKGTLPPIDVRIKAAKGFGYPDSVLLQMIQNHDLIKGKHKKLDECIDAVFGKCINSKVNKPKKKTVQECLNAKFKKKPARKFS